MSLDTKYRPLKYDEVIGQDGTVKVLRQIVKESRGFRQSYLFGGAWGSGKTTLARILARALLCENPIDGGPCDECSSCKTMLSNPASHECFIEVDAANNSGKADIAKIVEDLQYGTVSGKHKIYLFDECHELSRQAFDAMLLPMEDCRPGTEDKKLVCLFCTTEPEKMRPAILSRCAPAFTIRPCAPQQIAERLSKICEWENIPHAIDALVLVAEATECHIRDAIKVVEALSMLGGEVDLPRVREYLQIDANAAYVDILDLIGSDPQAMVDATDRLLEHVSPATAYGRLAEVSMLAYKVASLGVGNVPSYFDKDKLKLVGEKHGSFLIEAASRFAQRPYRATKPMLYCDLVSLHLLATGQTPTVVQTSMPVTVQVQTLPPTASKPAQEPAESSQGESSSATKTPTSPEPKTVATEKTPDTGMVGGHVNSDGGYVVPKAQRRNGRGASRSGSSTLTPEQFGEELDGWLEELYEEDGGPARQGYLGSS